MSIFAERVAAVLDAEAPALVERWQTQARAVAPRATARRAADAVSDVVVAQAITALGCALRRAPRCQDDVLCAGWEFGGRAHGRGTSLHYMVKELDLLEAMVLYVAQQTAERDESERDENGRADAPPPAGGGEIMGVVRRLQRTFAAMRLAATKGFTHAFVEALRASYRTLRHDLRNPIGTIRSAVALMEDESLPADVRFGARYRAMVTRNAASLETLVGATLGDAQASAPALTVQEVSLGELALAVRRDLREDAEAKGCTIELAPSLTTSSLPAVRVDSTAFELALLSLVDAAIADAATGSAVTVGLRSLRERSAQAAVTYLPAPRAADRSAPPGVSTIALDLAQRSGGRVWRENDATLLLELPVEARAMDDMSMAAVVQRTGAEPALIGDAILGDSRTPADAEADSLGAGPIDDGAPAKMEQLPRGGGPPAGSGEVASSR